ncbi:hypothetical protein CXG81DRAFT_10581 [Caulochytrium protostelioides]|uniref:OPT superfamily oligopeptide transporter n=1 Tax=Caulochytrium protostelioides TaxID=1555241 RepID=A0A4P9XB75_9FUNG|nr:OPT superfamily oligopeptide transporter [Caulochytrium protostelioides]RKP02615.1 hypothetical protein CXG81DRAFT_10581 [Caulochytrium protostelioides]|eukprot:RKP02615.1 hypothetical protein CXG81DRAFT_10581 [Caulochytrium protostelioides]
MEAEKGIPDAASSSCGPDNDALAIVPITDDPRMPHFTFRVFVLGTIWSSFLAIANAVLAFRTNVFVVPVFMATLVAYPMGRMMAAVLPTRRVKFMGYHISLNPGPFNIKEHVLITVIASAGAAGAYGIENVVVQRSPLFMGNADISFIDALAFVFVTQFVGFGIAGLGRRFLVKPLAMVWPSILSQVALFVSFHESSDTVHDYDASYTWSRYKMFWVGFTIMFCYTWIPEYFAMLLQVISIVCLLPGKDYTSPLKFMASADSGEGMGVGVITFDWVYIRGSQMTTPWWATVNFTVSNWVWGWILTPLVFYNSIYGMDQKLSLGNKAMDGTPIPVLNSPSLFDRNGDPLRANLLYDATSFNLNTTAYAMHEPIYITSAFALNYASSFMTISSAISHVALWYGNDIVRHDDDAFHHDAAVTADAATPLGASTDVHPDDVATDIHTILMSKYKDVPDWAYWIFLVACTAIMCVCCVMTPFQMPIWSVFLAIGLAGMFLLPYGIIAAITGTQLYLNVLSEFVIGLIIPGQTVAVMAFKSLGTNTVNQALTLLADLKLGHYMKIPPRSMIFAQLYGTFVSLFLTTGASFWVMDNMKGMLGKGNWQAMGYATFYNAGAIWGAIGPARFFGGDAVYHSLLLGFPIGFALPLVPWTLNKWFPHPYWKLVNVPLLSYFATPGVYQNEYVSSFFVAWFFQFLMFRYRNLWWAKYNYVLAAALDSGSSICILMITIVLNMGFKAPIWSLNPDIANGVHIDYYCYGQPYDQPPK